MKFARYSYILSMIRPGKFMMLAALGLTWLAMSLTQAQAQDNVVVVELFTSQGCNACPPADDLLKVLSERNDALALSLHVDYWDYLGWRDTFAQRQFGERQAGYRDEWHKNVVYTPQIVVQGSQDIIDINLKNLTAGIATAQDTDPPIKVMIKHQDGMLKCRIEPGFEQVSGTVWIAKYTMSATVPIGRGENAGRTITYTNVVNSLNRIGIWSGVEPEEVAMPQPDQGEGVAIWIQSGDAGPILVAAKHENPPPQ